MSAPHHIGAYQLLGELARGGMGVVYTARDTRVDRQVALKLMLHGGRGVALKRFEQEAALVARLQHPNVIKVHDVGLTPEGHPWFAMELIDGESLEEKLAREGPMNSQTAAGIAETLAHALAHAHERGVIHRDLKPANVLLTREGRPLLTDFGVARELSEERERLTRSGAMVGTPGFMPPEQATGQREIGAPADVYGLGATLYSMLTGRPPFVGATLLALMAEIEHHQPLPPSRYSPGLDRRLDAIVLKCLAKAPGDRYASAASLADDLGRYLRGESVEARVPQLRRRRSLVLLGAVGAVCIGVVGLVSAVIQRPDPVAKTSAAPTPSPAAGAPGSEQTLERMERLLGAAYQKKARPWLQANWDHPRAAEVRLRYLLAGLTQPRRIASLTTPQPVEAVDDHSALGLRSGSLFNLEAKNARTPPQVLGPFGGATSRRTVDRSRKAMVLCRGSEIWARSLGRKAERWVKLPPQKMIRRLAVSPKGDRLAYTLSEKGTVYVLSLPDRKPLHEITSPDPVDSVWFSLDGTHLLVLRRTSRLEVIELATQRVSINAMIASPTCLTVHPRDPGKIAAGFPLTQQIVLFKLFPFTPHKEMLADGLRVTTPLVRDQPAAHSFRPTGVAYHPSGRWLFTTACDPATKSPGELRVWDPETAEQLAFLEHRRGILSLSVTPNGERLVTVSATGRDFAVEVWEVGVAEGPH